jgi:hypothetical protein
MRTESDNPPTSPERKPDARRTPLTGAQLELLTPAQPPGRITRKARHYVPQIIRLREQGYTLEAIQQSLAAAGVAVSISTVRREAMRPMPSAAWFGPTAPPSPALACPTAAPAANASVPGASVSVAGASSGKEVAEAFARSKSANPLVRAKEQSS